MTDSGLITSPAGAYKPDVTLSGEAIISFNLKYRKGAKLPSGYMNFQLQVADLRFTSTNYEWLVVSGATSRYMGEGGLVRIHVLGY